MTIRTLALLISTFFLIGFAGAQELAPYRQEMDSINKQIRTAYQSEDWARGLELSDHLIGKITHLREDGIGNEDLVLQSVSSNAYYNAACLAAKAGETDRAFGYLENAVSEGFLNVSHLEQDTDLASLKAQPARFSAVIKSINTTLQNLPMRFPEYQVLEPTGAQNPTQGIVALPGAAQDLRAFADTMQELADMTGRVVIIARGSRYAGRDLFYWDESDFTAETRRIGEAIETAQVDYRDLDTDELIIIGYSQGAALAWEAALAGDQQYQCIVTIAGYRAPSLSKNADAMRRVSTPAYLIYGSDETPLVEDSHSYMVEAFRAQLQKIETKVLEGKGHEFPDNAAALYKEGIDWIESQ